MKRRFTENAGGRLAWLCGLVWVSTFTLLGQTTPPPNDAFTNRLAVSGLQVVALGTNTYATVESGEPAHAGQVPRRSLWWSWLAPYDGIAQLLVTNVSTLRTRSAVYLGSVLTNLSVVVSNAAATNRVVEFPVRAGETYQIVVDERYPFGATTFTLRLSLVTMLLTQPASEARLPAGRAVRLAVTNTETDHALTRVAYFASSNLVGTATEAPFTFDWTPITPARTNLSAVATNSLGARRESLVIWVTVTPPNDNFADALAIPPAGVSATLTGSNALAGAESGEPAHAGRTAAKSLWWSWTPAYSGRASIKITAAPSQPRVAIYTGTAVTNLVAVAAATAVSAPVEVGFEVVAGTVYFMALDSNSSSGSGGMAAQLALTTLRFLSPPAGTRVLVNQPAELVVTNCEVDHPLATLELMMNTSNTVVSGWSPPWSLVWGTNQPGQYTFKASGTNSQGELRVSDTVTVLVSPANDDFTNAFELPSLSNAVSSAESTTAFATHEVNEPVHQTPSAIGSVWFAWVSPWDGDINFSTEGSQSGPLLVVYSGDTLTNLVPLTTAYSQVARVVRGQRYYIAADAVAGYQGHVRVSVLPPPTNNDFANAIELTGVAGSFSGPNFSANSEPGEPVSAPENSASIWWRWTAPETGDFSFGTGSLGMTVQAGVYFGTSVSNLTAVVAPDISSSLSPTGSGTGRGFTFRAQAGVTYYFRFSGGVSQYYQSFGLYGTIAGNYNFQALANIPINDNFAGRLPLTGLSNSVFADNTLASTELGEPRPPSCDAAGRTLWWTYTAPAPGLLQVWATGVSNNVVCSLYRGAAVDQLQSVGYSCDQHMALMVQAGDAFVIAVDGAYGRVGGFTLQTLLSTAGANDNFANSIHLEGTNITAHGDPVAATFEPGEPNPGETNTIWFSWAAPTTGRATFSPGPVWWQPMAVYTGPTLSRLTAVRLVGTGNNVFSFLAQEGTVYHFQYAGGTGDFTLSLQLAPLGPCSNDNFADALLVKGNVIYFEPKSVMGATMELGEPAHLGATPQKSIWWKWQAPVHGSFYVSPGGSLATNVVLSAYRGTRVEALTLVGRSMGDLNFGVTGGETYYLAGAVPTNAIGDIALYAQYNSTSSSSRAVPGNLLREPSWEGTGLFGAIYWGMSGDIGGAVNEAGGADGTTWPSLGPGAQIWQDIATVPSQNHAIRFAYVGDVVRLRVRWDGAEVGIVTNTNEGSFWHWADFTAYATNTTTRILFENWGPVFANVAMDAFSVVPLTAPPAIVTQPASASVFAGGTAAFIVGVNGSAPLTYSWSLNKTPLTVLSNSQFVLESVTTNQAGTYQVVVSNPYGSVTSAPVTLTVEAPTKPVILWQPYGDTVGLGGSYQFSVVAAGTLPLRYQWFLNGAELASTTNRTLAFSSVDFTNAGSYSVRVQNHAGIAWSLGAKLIVPNAVNGGGSINFRNSFYSLFGTNVDAPVFDMDGVTPLNGSNFLAQLYGGPSLELLRPAGEPSSFRTGFRAGYFYSQLVPLPMVPPGSNAIVQVRAWEASKGSSYEEARALGGKFGKSELLTVVLGAADQPPANLEGLASFNLRAGLPQLASGVIEFVEHQPGGMLVWSHRGEPGFRYLIEKSIHGFEWKPYLVITNITSTATFTDSANSGSGVTFYRSRILD